MVWKLSQNSLTLQQPETEGASTSGNRLSSLVCTYPWLFSLSDPHLLFHPPGTWLWCRLSDTVHGIRVYFVQKLSLYLPAENACSAGLLAHTVARHWDLGGGTLERTQPRGTETAWSVVQDATADTWYSLLDTWCESSVFSMAPGGARWGPGQQIETHCHRVSQQTATPALREDWWWAQCSCWAAPGRSMQ